MRYIYWIAVCLFLSQEIEAQPVEGVGTEQPRLMFLSNHESRERPQLYLFDGAQPEELVKVNSPLPEGCPGKPWYERLTRFLISAAHANSPDPLAGCFRGILNFWITPDGQHVLYTTATTNLGFDDLHLVNLENPGHSIVVNEPQQEQHVPYVAAISPDSQSFVYFGKSEGEHSKSLYLVDVNNPRLQQRFAVPNESYDDVYSARYSPDGSRVAYLRLRGNSRVGKILFVEAAHVNRPPVVIAEDFDFGSGRYDFSAYGSHIIYNRRLDAPRESSVVLVDTADASHQITIDRRPGARILGVHLSPNRRFLLYGSFELTTKQSNTHVVDLAALGVRHYSESELARLPTARQEYTMPFAPDSLTLIGQSEQLDRGKQLYRFSMDDPNKRIPVSPTVPRYDFGYSKVYTPDSQKIIYRANLEGQGPYGGLYLSDLDRPINAERLSVTAEQRVRSFALSLNGQFVAYVAEEGDPRSAQDRNLYLIDLLNGNEVITTTDSASTALAYNVVPLRVEFLPPGPGYRE